MPDTRLAAFLDCASVDAAMLALRPDHRVLLLTVDGLTPGPRDPAGDALLEAAKAAARQALRELPVEQIPHLAACAGSDRTSERHAA
jgi:hypothetical protein